MMRMRWVDVVPWVGSLLAAALGAVLFPLTAAAQLGPQKASVQDWNRDWFTDRAEQDAFMGSLKQSAAENPELHGSVMLINDLVTGQPIGATGQQFGVISTQSGLLANEEFRAELDISDRQFAEMQMRQTEWMDQMRRELKSADRSDLGAVLRSLQQREREALQSLEAILLPPQRRRWQQALWEQQLRRRSLATLLSEAPLKDTLNVTDRQAEQLRELEAKLDQEIAQEVARLQLAAREKILGQLTPTQQSEAERILGPALRTLPQVKGPEKRPRRTGS
jgi:hypothetical protein